ncbi:hypothetical protein FEI13_01815 [Halomonas urmiana]|uniref:Uncharacterized protein n=1 Tax=Halomonas urmiana TaxID=490901 RepID=A0A5R8MM40_9GAMM|nr:hypothetical protein [Halomonas urmiana]TLF53357.1 hypothetical protein FEI13_01815 [Halomonas urmiana]
MAEHPDDRRHPRPIVPDPDASLSAPRVHHPTPPRVWPLWLLILLLIAAGAALAWAGWQERARLQAELARVSGELSNMHARFDAEQGRGEALNALQSRLDELSNLEAEVDAVLDRRLAELENELTTELETARAAQMAPLEERLARQQARLASLVEQAATRDATLAATRTSLDALERAGEEGRAALGERLATLEQARETQADGVETLQERMETLEAQLTQLDGRVEAAAGSRDDVHQRMEALDSGLQEMASGLRELRQSQLVLSAQLEALRQ